MAYPPQPPSQPHQNQETAVPQQNTMALVGFIMALAAIPMTFMQGWLGWALNLGAFIVSLIANSQIKQSNGAMSGKGLAVAGIVISSVWFGLIVLFLVVAVALGAAFLGAL